MPRRPSLSQPLEDQALAPEPAPEAPPPVLRRLFYTGSHPVFLPDLGVFQPHEVVEVPEAVAAQLLPGGLWRDSDRPTQPPPPPPASPTPPARLPTVTLQMVAGHARRFRGRIYVPGERVDVREDQVPGFLETGFFFAVQPPTSEPPPPEGERTLTYVGPEGRSIPGAGLFETAEVVRVSGARARLLVRSGLFNDLDQPAVWLAFNVPPPKDWTGEVRE